MRVTRATINETRHVAAGRQEQLRKIVDKVPDEILHRTNDDFVSAFLIRREQENLNVDQFFAVFDDVPHVIRTELGLVIDDVTEEELLRDCADVAHLSETLQRESEQVRKRPKSQRTLEHDVAHIVLARKQRVDHPKTWFLTGDRAVIQAAAQLATPRTTPLCFSISGLLQTISPFVTMKVGVEHSLADVFSSILSDQMGTHEHLYQVDELVVLADMHEDVLATRDENLVQAIDVVRNRVMKGQPFRSENAQRTALELRKFLASSATDRERAGAGERERLRGVISAGETAIEHEQARRLAAEAEAENLRGRVAALETNVADLNTESTSKQAALDALVTAAAVRARRDERNRALFVAAVGLMIVFWDAVVAGTINARFPRMAPHWTFLLNSVRAVGLFTIAVPWALFIRSSSWANEYKTGALVTLFACVYALLPWVNEGWASIFRNPVTWISLVVSILLAIRKP